MFHGNYTVFVYGGFDTTVIKSKLTSEWDYLIAAISTSLATSSLVLNGLLLGVKYMKRKKLRTIDFLIINLAMVDISLATTVFPLFIYSSAAHEWKFGDTGCKYFAFMSFALGVCSMMTLTEIAVVRYQMVCRGSFCLQWKPSGGSGVGTLAMMVFPYFYGGLWAAGPICGLGKYDYLPYGTSCSLMWDIRHLYFLVASCVFCLVIPVAAMVFSYARIVLKRKSSSRSIGRKIGLSNLRRSNLTLKTLSMCLAFVSAWTPYAIMGLLMMVVPLKQFPLAFSVISSLCAKASITTNPVLHAAISSTFRRDVKLLFAHMKSNACFKSHKNKWSPSFTTEIQKSNYLVANSAIRFTKTKVVSSENSASEKSTSL